MNENPFFSKLPSFEFIKGSYMVIPFRFFDYDINGKEVPLNMSRAEVRCVFCSDGDYEHQLFSKILIPSETDPEVYNLVLVPQDTENIDPSYIIYQPIVSFTPAESEVKFDYLRGEGIINLLPKIKLNIPLY